MPYTFYHCGVAIGQSDLEATSPDPRQRGGVFWPTTYGQQLFPQISGFLAATHELRTHLEATGVCPDTADQRVINDVLATTPAGRKILSLGRLMVDVELRAPDNRRLDVEWISFSEAAEIRRLAHALRIDGVSDLADLPPDAPRQIVSLALRAPLRPATGTRCVSVS